MTVGKVIRKRRIELGLTQEALAEEVKASRQSVVGWESDKYQPETQNIAALEAALHLPLGTLLQAVMGNPTEAPARKRATGASMLSAG